MCINVCDIETCRIYCLLQTPKGHYCAHNSPQLDPILSQMNPVHNILLYCNILFIIIIIIIIIIILGTSFMQGIYTYIPETNHVPREHCVATILM